ncbi:MAG TPA: murein L,D-transpeptidase catalytic domain family protein [Flavisolibacter sp.]|nr:murein L,D-transpeptidase catalytic domain family protein [Flavisolibacter sp.]
MKKIFLPTTFLCLLTLFFALSSFKARSNKVSTKNIDARSSVVAELSAPKVTSVEAVSNLIYDSLQLESLGLPQEVMNMAYKGHEYLAAQGRLSNTDVIAICDFSQSSDKKRLYIIDVKNYRVLFNTYVAHGKNSGLNYAEHFSNTPESLQSSLGFYVTKSTYSGKHGLSLKLSGQEQGFNDNAEARAVVVHGAEYIGDNRLGSGYMGRSFGCPAVPQAQSEKVINLLKNGTCLFIYHPTAKYLNGSKILNG